MPLLKGTMAQSGLAATCFSLGAILLAVGRGIANGEGQIGLDMSAKLEQNATSIDKSMATEFYNARMNDQQVFKRWAQRRSAQAPEGFGHLFAVFGWVFAIPVISTLGQVLGGGVRSSSALLVYAFVAGAILTVVEFVSEVGTATMSDWMSQWPILSQPKAAPDPGELTPVQSFEISYLLATSRTIWLYAMDNLLLGMTLGAASYLTYTTPRSTISKGHAHLGLLIALLCICDFFFEVTRLVNWRFSSNGAIATTLLIDSFFLPMWLLWLGASLRTVNLEGGVYTNHVGDSSMNLSHGSTRDVAHPSDVELAHGAQKPSDPEITVAN